ncbi:MAG: hypothetical protein ACLQMF_03300 [Rectinemataceae bacterium]
MTAFNAVMTRRMSGRCEPAAMRSVPELNRLVLPFSATKRKSPAKLKSMVARPSAGIRTLGVTPGIAEAFRTQKQSMKAASSGIGR